MYILLGALFEMSFDPSMNTSKNLADNNITLAAHRSQIDNNWILCAELGNVCRLGQIKEFQILNDTCSWTSTNEYNCNESKCINDDDDDECCCIKLLAEKAYKAESYTPVGEGLTWVQFDLAFTHYEEIIKFGLLRGGKYTIMKSYLTQVEHEWGYQYNQGMGWHRSEDMVHGINPSSGYLTNKKWIFNEDITNIIYDI